MRPTLIGLTLLASGGLYAGSASAQASNVYITPDGGGNGVCTNNTHPPSWFNNSGNWGNGATQIGPGTIVHLCGAFVGAQGTTMLTARGSGTNGNPIRLLFEQGTNFTSPAWSGATGAINISGQSYIVVDGGSTCGWVNNTSVPCNGTIQNTNAGTNLGIHPAGFTSNGVYAGDNNSSSCSPGCRVTNLNIINLYIHASLNDTSANQQVINAVTAWPAAGFRFDHNIVHDAGWAINTWGNGQEIDHNDVYNIDHAIASGIYNQDISGMLIHDNHIHDFANWDTASNSYHHDGIHLWSNGAAVNRNHMIYNNLFDGDCGVNITSYFYIEGNSNGITAFNNVFILPNNSNRNMAGEIAWGGGTDTNPVIVNNTFLGLAGGSSGIDLNGYTGAIIKNNLFAGTNTFAYLWGGTIIFAADYNQYEAQGAGGSTAWQYGAASINTNNFATWQSGLPGGSGQDAHSHYYSTSSVNSDGTLKPGSLAGGAGTNLTSLGITALNSDKNGVARPSSGSWTIGAYGLGTSTPTVLSAPTNLKATVQ